MTRYQKLMQQIEAQRQKEALFNARCEAAIAQVEDTLARIDALDAEIEADAKLLRQWSAVDQ